MIKRRDVSIKWKLYLYLLVFLGVSLAILWVFLTVFLDNFYMIVKTKETQAAARELAARSDQTDIERLIKACAQKLNAEISLYGSDGTLKYYSGRTGPETRSRSQIEYFFRHAKEAGDYFDDMNDPDGVPAFRQPPLFPAKPEDEMLLCAAAYGNNLVIIRAAITPVTAAVTTLRLLLIIITAMLALAAFFMSRVMSKKLAAPIMKTTESAIELARGNNPEFNAGGYCEIDSLNAALNYAQTEIAKSQALQKDIIANVSHDLRTPLTLITGYAEMLRDMPEEAGSGAAQVIIDEAGRLSALVNDVLDLSKLQSGVRTLSPEVFSITSLVARITGRVSELTRHENTDIAFKPHEDVFCRADKAAISQVIYNLLNNALNYGGEQKSVLVEQKLSEDNVTLSFTDNGEGISAEDIDGIWDKYVTGSGGKRGTGLGLSIVSSVLKLHDAGFGAVSEPGNGSTFWFTLKALSVKEL